MSNHQMNYLTSFVLLSLIQFIIITDASHSPKLKVNFGVNLPALSFKLPSMSLPKMQITAVIKGSRPKPMNIQLPAISLHAKSLEDTWGSEGGEYNQGYSGYSGGNNGNSVDEGKPYETGYASENEEDFADPNEDTFDSEDQSETNGDQQFDSQYNSGQSVNQSHVQPPNGNNYQNNKGFYEVQSPNMNPANGQPNMMNGQTTVNPEKNQPINGNLFPEMVPNQKYQHQMNHNQPRWNQNAVQNQPMKHLNPNNQIYGGHNMNNGERHFIVKLPHNLQLPQGHLVNNGLNGHQLNGNDNENFIHQLPYLKRIVVNNEPIRLANPIAFNNNDYRAQIANNQAGFSKRSIIVPNYYRYAILA
ncbi:GATA zinc finger domain-containing protein 14-like [Tetranychus urticae]|uniref:Uncharacterized protein n=1 Tax=Tetranychus urticae TaxID=32264 RepID=T1JTE9_TETUR|nr:GATA zinc finger domain-containing protein 14-like [Tetranychus urticae]